jgi:hypothetical protein
MSLPKKYEIKKLPDIKQFSSSFLDLNKPRLKPQTTAKS